MIHFFKKYGQGGVEAILGWLASHPGPSICIGGDLRTAGRLLLGLVPMAANAVLVFHSPFYPTSLLVARLIKRHANVVIVLHNDLDYLLDRATFLRSFAFALACTLASRILYYGPRPSRIPQGSQPKLRRIRVPVASRNLHVTRSDNYRVKRFIFVGRDDPQKGIDGIVHAGAMVGVLGKLHFYGPFSTARAKEFSGMGIEMYGFVADRAKIFTSGSVLLINSTHEGGPLVLFEALARGVPVYTTPAGIAKEFPRDGPSRAVTVFTSGEELAELLKVNTLDQQCFDKDRERFLAQYCIEPAEYKAHFEMACK